MSFSEIVECFCFKFQGDFDEEISGPLCVCLANCLMEDLSLPVFPNENITQE